MNFDFEGSVMTLLGASTMIVSPVVFVLNFVCSHFQVDNGGPLSERLSPWFFAAFFVGGAIICGVGLLLLSISTEGEDEGRSLAEE